MIVNGNFIYFKLNFSITAMPVKKLEQPIKNAEAF